MRAGDAGMVTAELAVAFPALVLAALLATTGVQVVVTQLRCLDAAGVAARLSARGEPSGEVNATAAAAAPTGASLAIRREGLLVRAQVGVQVHALGLGALLPGFTVSASAVSLAEAGE